jgi:threonine dehydratase
METFTSPFDIPAAAARITPYVRRTLLDYSLPFSQATGAAVHFKCENLQHTGSFKVRGAVNKLLTLSPAARDRGIVTASTGNHGAACAYALQQVGGNGLVFVPETAVPDKLAAIRRRGVAIRTVGSDSVKAESAARAHAAAHNLEYISPYNDPAIVAGQGTIGVELLAQLPELDAVFVSVGGGGLIGGLAVYLKAVKPSITIIGCSPQNSAVMAQSVRAGEILDLPSLPTLSDGTAGGVEAEAITFPLCRDFVDRYVEVTEAQIAAALREFIDLQHMLIEGSAAVALAGFRRTVADFAGKNIAIILCGANISRATLRRVLDDPESI